MSAAVDGETGGGKEGEGGSPSSSTVKSWRDLLPQLQSHAVGEKHGRAASLALKILEASSSSSSSAGAAAANDGGDDPLPDDVRRTVETIRARSLLNGGRYAEAVEFCKGLRGSSGGGGSDGASDDTNASPWHLIAEESYGLYRLKSYGTCRALILRRAAKLRGTDGGDVDGGEAASLLMRDAPDDVRHVYAQCCYRLGRSTEAADAYGGLLGLSETGEEEKRMDLDDDDGDERQEILTNALANAASNLSHPFPPDAAGDDDYDDALLRDPAVQHLLSAHEEPSGEYNYDLAFNAASYMLVKRHTDRAAVTKAVHVLRLAEDAAVSALMEDDASPEDIDSEVGPIRSGIALGCLLLGGEENERKARDVCEELISSPNGGGGGGGSYSNDLLSARGNLALLKHGKESLFDGLKRLPDLTVASATAADAPSSSSSGGNKDGGTAGVGGTKGHNPIPSQTRAVLYDRALLCLRMGKVDDCRDALRHLRSSLDPPPTDEAVGRAGANKRRGKKKKPNKGSTSSSSSGATGTAPPPPAPCATDADTKLWMAKIDVVESELLLSEHKATEADTLLELTLKSLMETLEKTETDGKLTNSERLALAHAVAELTLHRTERSLLADNNGNKGDDADDDARTKKKKKKAEIRIAALESLPPPIRSRPAVAATLAALKESIGDADGASAALVSLFDGDAAGAGAGARLAAAAFHLSLGRYEEAASLYESVLEGGGDGGGLTESEENAAVAGLVRALSYVDPKRAVEYAERLPPPPDMEEEEGGDVEGGGEASAPLDGAELEGRDVPRLGKKSGSAARRRIRAGMAAGDRDGERKKKNPEAVLRRRARNCEKYLAKLQGEGRYNPDRPVKPDAERWIPKNQRSYARRGRRGRQRFVGAQGVGTGAGAERDAAKLDAAARAAARASGGEATGPSTAHIHVAESDAVRKGGRRR